MRSGCWQSLFHLQADRPLSSFRNLCHGRSSVSVKHGHTFADTQPKDAEKMGGLIRRKFDLSQLERVGGIKAMHNKPCGEDSVNSAVVPQPAQPGRPVVSIIACGGQA